MISRSNGTKHPHNKNQTYNKILYLIKYTRCTNLVRSVHYKLSFNGIQTFLFVIGEHFMSGRQESIQIRDGSTWSQDGITTIPPNTFSHMSHDDRLHENENRSNFIREHICVCCGGQPFSSHRDQIQSARQLIEETRMTLTHHTYTR